MELIWLMILVAVLFLWVCVLTYVVACTQKSLKVVTAAIVDLQQQIIDDLEEKGRRKIARWR